MIESKALVKKADISYLMGNLNKPHLKAIAAMAQNRAIGYKNRIPWHLPEELRWFRKQTLHQGILMGRKTFESLGGGPLSLRTNYVLSRSPIAKEGIHWLSSIENIQTLTGVIWVCGGENLYRQLLPFCELLYLSVIKKEFMGDTFFPAFEDRFSLESIAFENDQFVVQKWKNRFPKALG